jgi:hypothetical protein
MVVKSHVDARFDATSAFSVPGCWLHAMAQDRPMPADVLARQFAERKFKEFEREIRGLYDKDARGDYATTFSYLCRRC